jgi:photosystem II stability/assembly factor-like uncharacterized protein
MKQGNARELLRADVLRDYQPAAPSLESRIFTELDRVERPSGREHRVLAGLSAAGPPWARGAVALVLAAVMVAGLLVVRQQVSRSPSSSPEQAPPPLAAHAIAAATFTSPTTGLVVQSTGISSTADGGRHWTSLPHPAAGSNVIVRGVWTRPGGTELVVTEQVVQGVWPPITFWRSEDGGAHWQELQTPGDSHASTEVSVKDADEAWVITEPDSGPIATVWHTTDGGQTWHAQATFNALIARQGHYLGFMPNFVGKLVFFDSTHAFLAETSDEDPPEFGAKPPSVVATSDGGASWSRVSLPDPPPGIDSTNLGFSYAVPTAGGQVALVLSRGASLDSGYVYTTSDGQHWSGPRALPVSHLQGHLTVLDDAHWWWAAGPDVYFSSDEGLHWSLRGALPRPLTFADVRFATATDGSALAPNLPGNVTDTLLTTTDGGRTWTAMTPPDPIHVRVGCDAVPAPVTYQVQLSVLYAGGLQHPPAGVGVTASCRYWLSTAAANGVIDVALPPARKDETLTLGDFLDVWGSSYLLPPGEKVVVTVNGDRYNGDARSVPLRPNANIVIEVPTAALHG